MLTYSYPEEFIQALSRTEAHSLPIPLVLPSPRERWLNPASATYDVFEIVTRVFSAPILDDLNGYCVQIHALLRPYIERWLGCEVFYTMGWIDDGTQKGLFKFDDIFIEKMLSKKYKGGKERVHAWLTLPSMEIIDVTLAATYIATNDPIQRSAQLMPGMIMACHPSDFQKIRYKPMLICNSLQEHIGSR